MGFAINKDKIEATLNRRRIDGRFSCLMFPPCQTLHTDTVNMKAVLQRSFLFLLCAIVYLGVEIFLFVTALVGAIFHFHRSHILHIHWRLVKLLYKFAFGVYFNRYPPMQYIYTLFAFGLVGLAWFLLLRWAWNRRAYRLNHEIKLPQSVVANSLSVWPPPPNSPKQL